MSDPRIATILALVGAITNLTEQRAALLPPPGTPVTYLPPSQGENGVWTKGKIAPKAPDADQETRAALVMDLEVQINITGNEFFQFLHDAYPSCPSKEETKAARIREQTTLSAEYLQEIGVVAPLAAAHYLIAIKKVPFNTFKMPAFDMFAEQYIGLIMR